MLHPRIRSKEAWEAVQRARVLSRLHRLQHAGPRATDGYISKNLAHMLRYCSRNLPFYKAWVAKQGRGARELEDFPIVDKDVLRRDPSGFVRPGIRESDCWINYSSGSTGEPMKFLFDRHTASVIDKATYYFGMMESGYRVEDRLGKQMDRPRKKWWMGLGFMRTMPIPTSGDHLATIRRLVAWRADCLYLSPSLGHVLAMSNARSKTRLAVRTVFTSNETLFPAVRDLLNECFNADVVDRYGSAEFPGVAWTCEEGNYHLIPEQVVEVLDSKQEAVGEGERGRIVITALHNTVMPLVRYDTQDVAVQGGTGICACGRRSPFLHRIEGRIHDLLVDARGWGISPMVLNPLMRDYENIRRLRAVQRRKGEATLEIVPMNQEIQIEGLASVVHVARRLEGRISLKVVSVGSLEDLGRKRKIVDSSVKPDWV